MKFNIGNLILKIALEYSEETKEITVKSVESVYEPENVESLGETRKINQTEARYYILTFGSTSSFGKDLPPGETIEIEYEGKLYNGKVHSSTIGRIDSLGEFFRDSKITTGDIIKATYIADKRMMKIKKTDKINKL